MTFKYRKVKLCSCILVAYSVHNGVKKILVIHFNEHWATLGIIFDENSERKEFSGNVDSILTLEVPDKFYNTTY